MSSWKDRLNLKKKVLSIKYACITKCDDEQYRFGYDGYRIELSKKEAVDFFIILEDALKKYSTDFNSICVRLPKPDTPYYEISRQQLLDMYYELKFDKNIREAL